MDTTTVTVINYNIGAPDLTDGLYVFDEDPICNYPETVTVTNLPDFMIHNEAASDFTVTQVTDKSLLGEYTVTLKSEICVPDDYTEATCTVMESEYDFLVRVQPCTVNDFVDTVKITDISYNVGDSDLIAIGEYASGQSPNCEYPETITLTNLPSFMSHNDVDKNFDIPQTSDLSLVGSYVVTIRSEIQVPDDYTGTTFTTMFVEYDFTVYV